MFTGTLAVVLGGHWGGVQKRRFFVDERPPSALSTWCPAARRVVLLCQLIGEHICSVGFEPDSVGRPGGGGGSDADFFHPLFGLVV